MSRVGARLVVTGVPGPYPIRVVSRMTGLSVDTLRAWERRYRVVKPTRSARGRSYDDSDVKRFQLLRAATGNGYAIGQVAFLSDRELEGLARRKDAPVQRAAANGAHIEAAFAAVQSFDSARLSEELGRMAALLSPAQFVYEVALPLMREVGERWHSGTIETAHEHLVTENIRNLMGAMARLSRPAEAQVKILATTPTDELHEVGVLAGALLASARGFHVTCLGPNLPAAQIIFAAERAEPQVVLLGLTTPSPLPAAIDTVHAVAGSLAADAELWLAGAGARRLTSLTRPGTFVIDDFEALERNLTRIGSGMKGRS